MSLRNAKDLTFRPAGVTDSRDGSNSFSGSMESLKNLVPSYSTPNVFVPRPAAVSAANLASINASGVVNALIVIGNRAYGMMESTTYAGKDQPFCYDLVAGTFVAISGITSALLPASPARTGDWSPPDVAAVTNSLLLFTHPGFAGGANPFFGWLDISGYVSSGILANTTNGSNVLTSIFTTQGSSAPILQGVQPGQLITGPGIPANAYVVSCANGTFSLNTTGNTHTTTTLDGLANVTGVLPGMGVSGPGIPAGCYVAAISGTTVTLSAAATATGTGVAINFSGGGTITISANCTATANVQAVTATGGTFAAPLWGAGNTNTNPLTIVPTACAGFNGRAYIGAGPYLVFSDPLKPLQVSQASQALVIGDNTAITALAGVPLTSQLTGGVQQSLTVFKGAGPLTQITGDVATNNLLQNAVAGSVGTLAPNSIAQTPLGTAFMAVDGLRVLGLSGVVSDPIGADGSGVAIPFINAIAPSRMTADYVDNVYRITVQNGYESAQPFEEYWFHFNQKAWTGPHTCPARMVARYVNASTFILAPIAANSVLWKSDVLPKVTSGYVENGAILTWQYTTSLLPDNTQGSFNRINQTSIAMALGSGSYAQVSAVDDQGVTLASVSVTGAQGASSVWGTAVWGTDAWNGADLAFRELPIKWPTSLVFRQSQLSVTGVSASRQAIGNVYAKYQPVKTNVPLQ